MRGISLVVAVSIVVLGPVSGWAGPQAHPAPGPDSAAMAHLKTLLGTWNGTTVMDGQPAPVSVEYRATSGGSAVVETLFPGTPHEMVSVYHDHDGRLMMTHYCLMGNQPRLVVTANTETALTLELAADGGVDPNTPHMHALSMQWTDPDHVTQTWTSHEHGQPNEQTVLTLIRAK